MELLLPCSCSFIIFFFLFPHPTFTLQCGDKEIRFPFSTARCHQNEMQIQFEDRRNATWYTVKEINYNLNTLTVIDQELGDILDPTNCNFLYVFSAPLQHFVPPLAIQFKKHTNCSWEDYKYLQIFIPEFYNLNPCKSYNIYRWNGLKNSLSNSSSALCYVETPHPPLEYNMSFSKDGKCLSLHSFGFSAHLKLLQQCFNYKICTEGTSKTGLIIGLSTAGGVSFILLFSLCFLIYRCRKKKQNSSSKHFDRSNSFAVSSKTDPELGSSLYTPIFSYHDLYEATNGFDAAKELGDGGFGTVYKGKLKDGRVVAVKLLYENNYRRLEQFINEIKILSLLRHQNLVSLYGCTSRRSRELILVYEFVPNGTVADHLHGPLSSGSVLNWQTRMSIAIETADALNYLHSIQPQIIHRDVKTDNILLDNSFHVKVADFGLSRLFPPHTTHVSTAPQGTPGYVDPEYHQSYQLTDKSDVYSFGVVLMELISSKPAFDISRDRNEVILANMAIKKIQRQELHEFVDPRLGYQSDYCINGKINQVAELAFQCLQPEREMRPCIKVVLEILQGIESGGWKNEACEEPDVVVKEGARLLKMSDPPYSPNSVADRWVSTESSMSSFSG